MGFPRAKHPTVCRFAGKSIANDPDPRAIQIQRPAFKLVGLKPPPVLAKSRWVDILFLLSIFLANKYEVP